MKHLVVFFVVLAASAASIYKGLSKGYKEGDRMFYFPGDGDNKVYLIDTQEPVDKQFVKRYALKGENNNEYWLFTRKNPLKHQVIPINNDDILKKSNYDPKKITVFLAHGWNGNGENYMNRVLTEVLLRDGDVNVIVLDWRLMASRNYPTALNGVPAVGKGLGQFVNWLVSLGGSYERMHLVGFSLGGHLVGSAGRTTGSRVKRITSLDPAGPLWHSNNQRVRPSDGQYVEVIHTCSSFLGLAEPSGHADFYPNGGGTQPGCGFNASCSHGKAVTYFAATVTNNHLYANKCESYKEVVNDKCRGIPNPMGNSALNKSRSGIFRVNTDSNYPYARTSK